MSKKEILNVPQYTRKPDYILRLTIYHNINEYGRYILFDIKTGFEGFEKAVKEVFPKIGKLRIIMNLQGGIIPATDDGVKLFEDDATIFIACENEPDPDPPLKPTNYLKFLKQVLNDKQT